MKNEYRAYKFVYAVCFPFLWLLWHFRFTGRENIPEGAAIVCANHSNLTDPLFVAFGFTRKRHIHFMAKYELSQVPVLSFILRKIGVFFVKRGESDVTAIRNAMRYLKNGERIMMFPEGTRTSEDDAVAAKTGAIRLASKLGVPIVPVYIPRDKKLFRRLDIVIGEPYTIGKIGHDEFDEQANELMRRINTLAKENA
jgi:1-acyl-sn-glycerol-3-phosphate acyltransferase